MNMAEFNTLYAPDNNINDDDNGFSTTYKSYKLVKVFVQFLLVGLASWFVDYANGASWSAEFAEFARQPETASKASTSALIMVWFSGCMLMHLYVYRRHCFYWSLAAGVLWLPFGDLVATPFWMAALGYFVAIFSRFHSFTTILFSLLILAGMGYLDIYLYTWHLNFFYVWVFLVIMGSWLESKRSRAAAAKKTTPHSRLDFFNLNADDNLTPDEANEESFEEDNRAVESVWGPGEKEAQEDTIVESEIQQENTVNASAPKEEKLILTAAQRPFAVFWKDVAMLKKQYELPALLQAELNGVIEHTERILQCMQDDPQDVKPGTEFLHRYLPLVSSVVKRGLTLSGQLRAHSSPDAVEHQCLQALQALKSAFAQQHLRLLENDTLAFETDLSVLNSLLKTDGFKP